MLEVKNLNVYYGEVQALDDVTLTVGDDEIVSIIGANGAGKSSLMKTIMGDNRPKSGQIIYNGKDITGLHTHKVVEEGLVYIPEGRRIFYELSVQENIEMGAYSRKLTAKQLKTEMSQVLDIFPRLRERLNQAGGTLSGGEQQMLAIARGLMSNPRLLMLDEPSLGLAPIIVDEVFEVIKSVNRDRKIPVILVEQNAYMALSTSSRTYILELGHITAAGPSKELLESDEVKKSYLGG